MPNCVWCKDPKSDEDVSEDNACDAHLAEAYGITEEQVELYRQEGML